MIIKAISVNIDRDIRKSKPTFPLVLTQILAYQYAHEIANCHLERLFPLPLIVSTGSATVDVSFPQMDGKEIVIHSITWQESVRILWRGVWMCFEDSMRCRQLEKGANHCQILKLKMEMQ